MFAEQTVQEKHFLALLLCLVVVLVLGRLVAVVFRAIKQPVVIGEVLVGIALGPSLLGQVAPDLHDRLFNAIDLPFFKLVASLGLVLFMFIVGMEVDLDVIRSSGKRALVISLTSIALPFALGFGILGHLLYQDHQCVAVESVAGASVQPCTTTSKEVEDKIAQRTTEIEKAKAKGGKQIPNAVVGRHTDFAPFAMFIGVSMCGTAFAVLARVLSERNMFRIPLGLLLIACAAIDDIVAFTLLALSTALAAQGSASNVILIVLKLVAFTAVLFVVVRPLLERFVLRPYRASGKLGAEQLSILLAGLLLSSYITSSIGVHELIGAFLFGVAVPRRNAANLFHSIADRLEGVSVQLLLPVYFVIAGQGVYLQGLTTHDIGPALLILVIACVGKFVGGATAARVMGVPKRQSLAVGTMMNTRGLAELVILQVGRDAGVIDDKVYTMLVIMAIITTAMAGPLLRVVYPDRWLNRDIADADRKRSNSTTDRVAIVVGDVAIAQPLAEIAAAYGGGRATGSVTIIRFSDQGTGLAGFADDLGEMKALRETIEGAGLICQIITRVSADRAGDMVAEVSRLAPGAVVVGAADSALVEPLRHLGCDVLTPRVPLGDIGSVSVHTGGSSAELASLEMGARLALFAHVPLRTTGSLARRTAKQLGALGIDHTAADAMTDTTTIITTTTGGGQVTVGPEPTNDLIVHPGERDHVPLIEALGGWVRTEPIILSTR